MRTADTIYQDLLPELPGVPEPMVERALLRCAQELCRRARVWTVWTDPVTIQDGTTEYDVELPEAGAQVHVIERATRNGRFMEMVPWTFLRAAPDEPRAGARLVPGRISFQTSGLVPGDQIRFRVVLTPTDTANGVPDDVFDQNSDLLVAGIKARLMLTPNQPFTNFDLGAANASAWSAGVATAGVRTWRGNTDGTKRDRVMWC